MNKEIISRKNITQRLDSLDGLRGLAILLVLLTHINLNYIIDPLPPFFRSLTNVFLGNGFTGVAFLFILCGFLMQYLYPRPSNNLAFIQKRYTRIFPLFISMVLIRSLTRFVPTRLWYGRIGIIFVVALLTNFVWIKIIKKINRPKLSQVIFYSFIVIQILAGLFYAFWIMRQPAIVFNQQLPAAFRIGFSALTNATLMLPFGNYIPMLDGVYWTLTTEVLFYILYPFILVPLIETLKTQSRPFKLFFLIGLLPLLAGIGQLSHHILAFNMIQFPMFFFFATGIALAYLYRNSSLLLKKIDGIFDKRNTLYLPFLLIVVLFWLITFSLKKVSLTFDPWLRMFWAIPLTFIVAIALGENKFASFLKSKVLVFLGAISYSIYLCHTEVIEIIKAKYWPIVWPNDIPSNLVFLLVSIGAILSIAFVLNHLLEKPYFQTTKKKLPLSKYSLSNKQVVSIFIGMILIYLLAIALVYQSKFNFFSYEYSYDRNSVVYPTINKNQRIISMRDYPKIKISFQAQQNNLGIVSTNFVYREIKHPKPEDQLLRFRLKEKQADSWYYSTEYSFATIGNGDFLFGFPQIANSKNKTYEVELGLTRPITSRFVDVDISRSAIKSVYQIDKKELLHHPRQLLELVSLRISNVITNREAQLAFCLFLPFFLSFIWWIKSVSSTNKADNFR